MTKTCCDRCGKEINAQSGYAVKLAAGELGDSCNSHRVRFTGEFRMDICDKCWDEICRSDDFGVARDRLLFGVFREGAL